MSIQPKGKKNHPRMFGCNLESVFFPLYDSVALLGSFSTVLFEDYFYHKLVGLRQR